MNIANIEENSLIYGPGIRYVIWMQGCSIRCKGCWNNKMWSFNKRNDISTDDIVSEIVKQSDVIDGVTILGGEPFDQYDDLMSLVKKLRKKSFGILLYTGYSVEQLTISHKNNIFSYIDVLISEPYIEKERNIENGGLIGSDNQKYNFFSEIYSENDFTTLNQTEISIDEFGKISMYGYPDL